MNKDTTDTESFFPHQDAKLTARMFHELSTPLFILSGRAELLQFELPANDVVHEHTTVMLEQVSAMQRIMGRYREILAKGHQRATIPRTTKR